MTASIYDFYNIFELLKVSEIETLVFPICYKHIDIIEVCYITLQNVYKILRKIFIKILN